MSKKKKVLSPYDIAETKVGYTNSNTSKTKRSIETPEQRDQRLKQINSKLLAKPSHTHNEIYDDDCGFIEDTPKQKRKGRK